MKNAPLSRRDRLRHILADLRMPGALEALDAILHGVDGGTLTAPEAIEQLLTAQIFSSATIDGCRPPCAPAGCPS
jgi:hypothetical protein